MAQHQNLPHYPDPYDPIMDGDNLDIKRYLSLFISNWYWFAAALFLTMTLAYGINRYSEKIWTLSASLLIKDDQLAGSNNNISPIVPGGDLFKSQQNLKNEMGILRSFTLNYEVMKESPDFQVVYKGIGRRGIAELRLYNNCPFIVKYSSLDDQQKDILLSVILKSDSTYTIEKKGSKLPPVNMKFGERYLKDGFDFCILPRIQGRKLMGFNSSDNYVFYFRSLESLANEYRGKLYVSPIEKDASIVILSVAGYVPEQEADYLNRLMEVYIRTGQDNKTRTADSTIKFIQDQIGIVADSLKRTEADMAVFREKNKFYEPSKAGNLIQGKLEKLDNERAKDELQLQYYNYISDYLKNGSNNDSILSPSVIGIGDPSIYKLVGDYASLLKEKSKLALNIETSQPAINLVNRQLQEIRNSLLENIRNGIVVISKSIDDIDGKTQKIEEELKDLPTKEIEYIKVQRKFDINNTVYTYLLEKRAETGIAKSSIVADNRVIDRASLFNSAMIKPKSRKNYMIALILGLMLPMVAIIGIDFLNDKVIDKRDVERKTNVPVIGYIGHSDDKKHIPVIERPSSSMSESFRSVRTSLKYFIKENQKPVIAVSSTISSEGKTFISVNLAAIIAMLGKKVLLIGLDLRKPRLSNIIEFEKSPGLSNYLIGNCGFDDVIRQTQIENLFYAPSGPIPPNPSELIESDYMNEFIKNAKEIFEFIIIDTPPVAIVTDALLLSSYADINLFIVRQRYTSRSTLEIIEQLHRDRKLKNMGILINDINLSGYFGYGMRYRYSPGYGYSYGYSYYGKGYTGRYGYSDKDHGYYKDEL